jgi:DNA-binding response OmpR family regulator
MLNYPARILIVEDEPMLAMDLEFLLKRLGCEIAGIASRLDRATQMARDLECDGAVLDLNLDGASAKAVADVLTGRGIPFIFATGYGDRTLGGRFKGVPVVEKPYDPHAIKCALEAVLAAA